MIRNKRHTATTVTQCFKIQRTTTLKWEKTLRNCMQDSTNHRKDAGNIYNLSIGTHCLMNRVIR